MELVTKHKFTIAMAWLTLVHVSGAIGLAVSPAFFLSFTPLNLLMGAVIVGLFQSQWSGRQWGLLGITAIAAWFIEWLGVSTGLIFGQYHYGASLGIAPAGIPLLIGVNWAVLVYCSIITSVVYLKLRSNLSIALASASIMVLLDSLMEYSAPLLDFWKFDGLRYAPAINFVGWFVVALVLSFVNASAFKNTPNRMATQYLLLQFLFFTALLFLL